MRRNEQGFSLVETLVALTILAAVVATLATVIPANNERHLRALARTRAILAADAILARVGLDIPLRTQRTTGRLADSSFWSIDVAPFAENGDQADTSLTALRRITVQVVSERWPADRAELTTLRLAGTLP